MNSNKNIIKYAGIIACAIGIIGAFLPFVYTNTFIGKISAKYIEGDGIFIVIALIAEMILLAFNKYIPSIVLGSISLIIIIIDAFNATSNNGIYEYKIDIGFFVVLIGAIISIIVPIIGQINSKKTN